MQVAAALGTKDKKVGGDKNGGSRKVAAEKAVRPHTVYFS